MEYESVLSVLNEVYFGNSKEIIKIQEQFSKFRKKFIEHGKYMTAFNTDPDLLEFNRMIERFFGFETFALIIEPSPIGNAYTLPISNRIDTPISGKKYIESTSNGFRFKKEAKFNAIVYVHSPLIIDSRFTDREVFAIILHELGHNFAFGINSANCVMTGIQKAISLVNIIFNGALAILLPFSQHSQIIVGSINKLQGAVNKKADEIKKNNPDINDTLYRFKGFFSAIEGFGIELESIFSVVATVINPIGAIISGVYSKVMDIAKNPMILIRILFGYGQEKVADNFATIYGYGPDLTSGLFKLEKYVPGANVLGFMNDERSSFIGLWYNLIKMPAEIVCSLADEHPNTVSRINDQIKSLKIELDRNEFDPKMKASIKKDIEEIEKVLKKSTDNVYNGDPMVFKYAYNGLMLKLFGGDIKDIFTNTNKRMAKIDKAAKDSRITPKKESTEDIFKNVKFI